MARELKSPILAEAIDSKLYRLFFKIWQISGDGSYHSPREEEAGIFVEAGINEPYEHAVTTYNHKKGPSTKRFKKHMV